MSIGFYPVFRSLALIAVAFLPPLIYVIWIRNTERYQREPWKAIFLSFIWGATIAIIASGILELFFGIPLSRAIHRNLYTIVIAVVIAPFIEELVKPLALTMNTVRKELDEVEDGLIYGAVAGLGFSATENLLYEWSHLSKALSLFIFVVVFRSIACCLIHASATALTGYGYGMAIIKKRWKLTIIPFFLLAIFIHSFYNFIVSMKFFGGIVGITMAIIFSIGCIRWVRKKIKRLDAK